MGVSVSRAIPKYRRKAMYGGLRHHLGDVAAAGRAAACWRSPHVVSIPPKYAVAQVIGYIGKSAIHMSGVCGPASELRGATLLGRGYYVGRAG